MDLPAGRLEGANTEMGLRSLARLSSPEEFNDLILRNELSQSEIARLTARSRNYTQFLRLLTAIEKAEALNTRVLID